MQTALAENKKQKTVQNRANTFNDSVNGRSMSAIPVLQKNEEKITANPEQDLQEKSGLSALLQHAGNTLPGNAPANPGEEDAEHKGYFAFSPKKVMPEKATALSSVLNSVKTNSIKEPEANPGEEDAEHKGYFAFNPKKAMPEKAPGLSSVLNSVKTNSEKQPGANPGEEDAEHKGYFAFSPKKATPEKATGLSSVLNLVKTNSGKEPEEKKEHEAEGENKGWFSPSPKVTQKPSNSIGSFFKNILGNKIVQDEDTKEPDGKEEPVAVIQNEHGANSIGQQQSAFMPAQESGLEQNTVTDTEKEESSKVIVDFFNSGASVIAKGINGFSNRISTGFQNDAAHLMGTTPVVHAGLKKDAISDPVKPGLPEEAVANTMKPWLPPSTALRTDTPKFKPTTDANPQEVETEAAANSARVTSGANHTNANLVQMPGEELVQGREINPSAQVELTASKTLVPSGSFPEMEEYMNIEMADGFRQEVDEASAGMYSQTLEGPRNQVENAKAKRDLDQAGAISDANQKADEFGRKASDEQAQTVNESRSLIGAEKEKSLEESKATLAEYDGKVSAEKQSKLDEINTQIAAHETQANSELNNADKKVAAEQQKANTQKAEEERKAEEKKRNRKWWQKIGDFFSDIANALASVVNSIISVLASVVKTIVSVAKTLASTIINTCTSLVKKLLNTFAAIVKGFLDIALAAFPGIRDRLNAFIDKAVSKVNDAIDKVAKGLTDAIDTLCDTLTKIIDSAQVFLVAMVQGAVMMFNALITGNFADMPRIAFMTACNSLGLPGEELWAIVQKASGEAMEIVKHPASFLGNLIKAGEKGFGQFLANIKQRLMSGLMGWLLGQVGQSGVTIPEKFDGASIFLVVRQVLGVTYEHVRERAVGIMGEKNVERAEAVLNYLKRLFTEGPEVLFEEMKGKAEEMKSSFVTQIEDWAINTVIQKAVIKVSSMLVPGSGFVQSIYGMWQTIQFFLENIKKIAAVVNSLLDSLADISRGAIGNAANLVEKTMTDTLPLVFAWLAKLIGVDGVGQKVKGIVDKLRTPVNTAVDFVINGAIKLGTSAVNAVKSGAKRVKDKVMGWWKKRKEFTTKDGENHAVYIEGEGKNVQIMVNPTPKQKAEAFLKKAAKIELDDEEVQVGLSADIKKARDLLLKLDNNLEETVVNHAKDDMVDEKDESSDSEADIDEELDTIKDVLKRIMDATHLSMPEDKKRKRQGDDMADEDVADDDKGEGREENYFVSKYRSIIHEKLSIQSDVQAEALDDRKELVELYTEQVEALKYDRKKARELKETKEKLAAATKGLNMIEKDIVVFKDAVKTINDIIDKYNEGIKDESIAKRNRKETARLDEAMKKFIDAYNDFVSKYQAQTSQGFSAMSRANEMGEVEISTKAVVKGMQKDTSSYLHSIEMTDKDGDTDRLLRENEKVFKENLKAGQKSGPLSNGYKGNESLEDKKNNLEYIETQIAKPVDSKQSVTVAKDIKYKSREKGQMSQMGNINATTYAFLSGINDYSSHKWEWLHIRGAALGGITNGTNLVVGTFDTNTQMMPFESNVVRLANEMQNNVGSFDPPNFVWEVGGIDKKARHKVNSINMKWMVKRKADQKRNIEEKIFSGEATFNPLNTNSNISKNEVKILEEALSESREGLNPEKDKKKKEKELKNEVCDIEVD